MKFIRLLKLSAISIVLLLFSTSYLLAQTSLRGKILNEKGIGLPGVSVSIKGTTMATSTDDNGNFVVQVPAGANVLIASSIGFRNQEVLINQRNNLSISMTADATSLQDIVVVGYGEQKRRDITGAVSSIKGKDIQSQPLSSIDAMMQGRAPGVQVTQNTGSPGGGVSIRIRGVTSINASNEPLYILDGVPIRSGTLGGIGGTEVNALADINPDDIENIEVLKDASTAAIYGARAANGELLITTKRGKAGVPAYSFNYYTGVQRVVRKLPLQNNLEVLSMIKDQFFEPSTGRRLPGTGVTDAVINATPFVTTGIIQEVLDFDSSGTINTDWQDQIFQTAPVSNYDFSVRGGSEQIQYSASAGYFKQTGIMIGTSFDRVSARTNLDYKMSAKLKLTNSIMFSRSHNKRGRFYDATRESELVNAVRFFPNYPVYNPDGTYFRNALNVENPVALANELYSHSYSNRLISNTSLEYKILPALKFVTSFGTDILGIKQNEFLPSTIPVAGASRPATSYYGQDFTWINENTLTYAKRFADKHDLNALAGYSQQVTKTESLLASTTNSASNDLTIVNGSILTAASSGLTSQGLTSLFGRITYALNDKYLFTANLRRDGSSKFGLNNKYGFFPSASVGWRISDEAFMKNVSFVNELKLRASAGLTGNQNGIGNFTAFGTFSPSNYGGQSGFASSSIPNPNLSWEKTMQYNVGFDMGIADQRITLVADVYLKLTTDLLLNQALPRTTGYGSILRNIGSSENKGIEFGLSSRNFTGAFKWNTDFNISFNKNKITALADGNQDVILSTGLSGGVSTSTILRVGEPIGVFYGYVANGVYATDADNKTGIKFNNILRRGGDLIISDLDGDGNISSDKDRAVTGSSLPRFTGGFNNTFSYKGIQLNAMMQFSYGNKIYNNLRAILDGMNFYYTGTADANRRWRNPGDITDVPRALRNNNAGNASASTRWIEDGSYLKLKTISLAYSLPVKIIRNLKLQSVRVYGSMQNALTFTNYKGYDPDVNYSENSGNNGIDGGNYPQARTTQAGINIGF